MSFIPAEEDSEEDFEDAFFSAEGVCEREKIKKTVHKLCVQSNSTSNTFQSQHCKSDEINIPFKAFSRSLNTNQNKTELLKENTLYQKSSSVVHDVSLSSLNETNIFTMEDLKKAVVRGNKSLVQHCLNQDLPLDLPYKGGWTALMYAANYAHPDVVEYLLVKGANANYHSDFFTPLMAACSASDAENEERVTKCVNLLLEAGADVNSQDRLHITSLMLASREGHVQVAQTLIDYGAEVNKQDGRGWTALTWAVQRYRKNVVIYLLDSGADPNIQHNDKLSVVELAATFPTNEMLELLLKGYTKETNTSSSNSTVDLERTQPKCEDLKVFLLGLDLPHLVEVFQQQLIDLGLLMTLTEQDLIQVGVDQVGARKKILDAVNAVHKKDWQPSSLISFHYNKKLSCADVIAVMANTSKHLRYINSTVLYIKGQLQKHPEIIMQPTDQVSPVLFTRHIDDAMKNIKVLNDQLLQLTFDLNNEMKLRCLDPADLVQQNSFKYKRRKHMSQITVLMALFTCVAVPFYFYRNTILGYLPLDVKFFHNS